MQPRFHGKTALVTGGNSGIGLATAKEFIAHGARVIITGRAEAAINAAAADLGGDTLAIRADQGSLADLDALAQTLQDGGITLDVLFVNAGIGKFAPVEGVDEAHFDELFNVNVKGLFFTVQKLLPLMNDGGSIVFNGSISGSTGAAMTSVYSATKAAVISFAKTLSSDLLARRIRVNTVSPGPIATPIWEKTGLPQEVVQGFAAGVESGIPMKRFGTPEEIAKAVVFLASNDASFILGADLAVDGGAVHI